MSEDVTLFRSSTSSVAALIAKVEMNVGEESSGRSDGGAGRILPADADQPARAPQGRRAQCETHRRGIPACDNTTARAGSAEAGQSLRTSGAQTATICPGGEMEASDIGSRDGPCGMATEAIDIGHRD